MGELAWRCAATRQPVIADLITALSALCVAASRGNDAGLPSRARGTA